MQTAGIPIKMLFEFSVKHSSDYYYSSNTECTENGIQYSDNVKGPGSLHTERDHLKYKKVIS